MTSNSCVSCRDSLMRQKKTANPPDYAKDVFGAISPVLKKAMPAARMRAVHQIDVLTRAKARLEELMEADYESD